MSIDYSKFAFPKPERVLKKKKTPLKGKKYRQTKRKEIEKKTKLEVWKRDNKKCIFCGKAIPWNYANAHYIKRSAGGLGIPKNIFTACEECHRLQDNGLNSNVLTEYAKNYLKSIYKKEWREEDLVYKKY